MDEKLNLEELLSLLRLTQDQETLEPSSNALHDAEYKYDENYINRLKKTFQSFIKKEQFEIGQIVKWKENLKNRKLPRINQPAIVIDVLVDPIILEEDIGNPYFRERLDVILGILYEDDIFLTFYYDSRRFESYMKK